MEADSTLRKGLTGGIAGVDELHVVRVKVLEELSIHLASEDVGVEPSDFREQRFEIQITILQSQHCQPCEEMGQGEDSRVQGGRWTSPGPSDPPYSK